MKVFKTKIGECLKADGESGRRAFAITLKYQVMVTSILLSKPNTLQAAILFGDACNS